MGTVHPIDGIGAMNTTYALGHDDVERLISRLRQEGHQTVGPTVRSGVIVLDVLKGLADLPVGWQDRQQAGHYRLHPSMGATLFGYSLGPQSWKKYLYPSQAVLCQIKAEDGGWQATPGQDPVPSYAFVGVRACEIQALFVLDRVLAQGSFFDPFYRQSRQKAFILAVHCLQPGGTCFCASMQTGPRVRKGFDIVLTELPDLHPPRLMAEAGSEKGDRLLRRLSLRPAVAEDGRKAELLSRQASCGTQPGLALEKLRSLFSDGFNHPHWETLEAKCLACGNCTLVCPTCFCHTIVDGNSLDGRQAERRRMWDSCFSQDFAYMHGGSLRTSVKARYRQWLTHKLATWFDQFGTCGCVGCGRCITWCPAGIDITQEARMLLDGGASRNQEVTAP
jgi:sulfhydrogenase subunit beta (sulfur reductase)